MTRYYQPRQRISNGRWDYTSGTNSSGIFAIGYCAGWPEHTRESLEAKSVRGYLVEAILADQEKRRPSAAKYHSDGHATAEEAVACHLQYELDTALAFVDDPSKQERCATCEEWTTGRATFRGDSFLRLFALCPKHQTREDVEKKIAAEK